MDIIEFSICGDGLVPEIIVFKLIAIVTILAGIVILSLRTENPNVNQVSQVGASATGKKKESFF